MRSAVQSLEREQQRDGYQRTWYRKHEGQTLQAALSDRVYEIHSIDFKPCTAKEIRQEALTTVRSSQIYRRGRVPARFGLLDMRMGTRDSRFRCATCGQSSSSCDGHMGCVELAMPVYNPHYLKYIQAILQSICARCMRPRVHKPDETPSFKMDSKGGVCSYASRFKDQTRCAYPSCGVLHPTYKRCSNTYIRRIWSARAKAVLRSKLFESDPNRFKLLTGSLRAVEVHDMFEVMERVGLADRLRAATGDGMGAVKPLTRLFFDTLPVSPVSLRPTIILSIGSKLRSESEQTIVYQAIVKENAKLLRMMLSRARSSPASDFMAVQKFKEVYDALQAVVSMFVSSSARAHNPNISRRRRSGEMRRALSSYLTGKTGLLRSNVQGKRGNNGARTVVTGDPHIPVDVVTVPQFIATRLHRTERVTRFNLAQMRRRVLLGPGKVGGAFKILLPPSSSAAASGSNQRPKSYALWKVDRERIANSLAPGFAVVRYLESGDRVLFNRQPSLSKKSMMVFRVKVVPDHGARGGAHLRRNISRKKMPRTVFGMHLSVTTAFNADFDGDEMNIHMLNSHEAEAEGKYLVSVSRQVTNELNSKTTLCIVQDSVLGAYLLSRDDQWLTRSEFMQLIAQAANPDASRGLVPPPDRPARDHLPDMWSGKQVLSSFMPPISLASGSFRMDSGVIRHGHVTKRILNGGFRSILYKTAHYCGDGRAVQLAEDLQRVTRVFLNWRAGMVAIGADNLVARTSDEESEQRARDAAVREACFWGSRIIQIGLREGVPAHTVEADAQAHFGALLKLDRVERKNEGSCRSEQDALRAVVESGSKGSWINLAQMRTCVGQQSQNGSRLGVLPEDSPDDPRLSAHELFPGTQENASDDPIDITEPWSDPADAALRVSPRARGFVASSFREGLSTPEFFYHSMSGRVGVIDTSCKTAESGYLQRKLSKALEDLVLGYDYTVRDVSSEAIVSFLYGGGDGFDPKRLCAVTRRICAAPAEGDTCACSLCRYRKSLMQELENSRGGRLRGDSEEPHFDLPFDPECLWRQVRARARRGPVRATAKFIEGHASELLRFLQTSGYAKNDGVSPSRLRGTTATHLPLRISVAYHMCPSRISTESKERVLEFVERAKHHFIRARACPGDSVGASAATSLGASLTQSTLNTFHFAGVAEKRAMTLGIPRYKELVNASTNISNAYVDVHPLPGKRHADAGSCLRCALWPQIDPRNRTAANAGAWAAERRSALWKETSFEYLTSKKRARNLTTRGRKEGSLRLDLALRARTLPPAEVCRRIRAGAPWGDDPDLPALVVRDEGGGRLSATATHPLLTAKIASDVGRFLASALERMVLDPASTSRSVRVGAKDAWVSPDGSIRVLMSGKGTGKHSHMGGGGVSLSRAIQRLWATFSRLGVPFDFRESYSNDISAVCNALGAETARAFLEREFMTVLCSDGTYISRRHVILASDFMMSRGTFTGMTRHDYKRNLKHRGVLARACFEQPVDVFVDAAASSERDSIKTASARVMVGRRIQNGTGSFAVLTDSQYASLAARYGNSAAPPSFTFGQRKYARASRLGAEPSFDAANHSMAGRGDASRGVRSDRVDTWSSVSNRGGSAHAPKRLRDAGTTTSLPSSRASKEPRESPEADRAAQARVMKEHPRLYAYENLMRAAHVSFAQSRCERRSCVGPIVERQTPRATSRAGPSWLYDAEGTRPLARGAPAPGAACGLRAAGWSEKGVHPPSSSLFDEDGTFGDDGAFGIESALECAYKASTATLQMQ